VCVRVCVCACVANDDMGIVCRRKMMHVFLGDRTTSIGPGIERCALLEQRDTPYLFSITPLLSRKKDLSASHGERR